MTMIVWRLTGRAKSGYTQQQLVEMMKSIRPLLPNPSAMRIYVAHPAGAPGYMVVTDIEFESLATLEQWLKQWFARPDAAEFMEKVGALEEPGGDTTLWNLVE
jgi:hypothetical protein